MAAADPKWLELLKASGWQTASLTAASATILYLNAKKWLPVALDSWVIQTAEVSFLVFGFLTIFSVGPHIMRTANIIASMVVQRFVVRRSQRQVAKDIPSMSSKEREIIGYLLANNLKMFDYTIDGGAANSLLSKRIVVCALLPGQSSTAYGVPFKVPDHVWNVLVEYKAEFPNTWKPGEPLPYAISWMER
jgi:superinfection exclusion protein B